MDTNARHDEPRTLGVPRSHEIDNVDFEIYPTGDLSIGRSGEPLIELTARQAYGLLTFLRVPGVAQLLDQVEAARQAQNWRDFEEDPQYAGEWHADTSHRPPRTLAPLV